MRKGRCAVAVALAAGCLAPTLEVNASPSGGAIPPPIELVVPIAGAWGVPDDAIGVALNLTITSPVAAGYAVVYPCGQEPLTSNINFVAEQTVPNFVIARLDGDGDVCVSTSATADVILDIAGYVPAGSPITFLGSPNRVVDTRIGQGIAGRVRAGQEARFGLGAAAGIVNVTVTDTARAGHLTVYPCGGSLPPTSTSNFTSRATVPNLVVTAAGGAGAQVCLQSTADTEVVVDVAATLPAGYSGIAVLPTPERIVDTRIGLGGPRTPLGAVDRPVQVGGSSVPLDATAAIVNLTGTQATADGFVSAYPCGGTPPTVSNLNVSRGNDVANTAIVKLATDGRLCLRSNTTTDVIVDITGYVRGAMALVPLTPTRIFDSREGNDPVCNLGIVATRDPATSGAVFRWIDLATGEESGRFYNATSLNSGTFAHVEPGCSRAWIGDGGFAQQIDRAGNRMQSLQTGVFVFMAGGVPFGRDPSGYAIATVAAPRLFDMSDPTLGIDFDRPSDPAAPAGYWYAVGASDDLSIVVWTRFDTVSRVAFAYDTDGHELGSWPVPRDAANFALSPGGTYLSFHKDEMYAAGPIVVTALGGEVVATTNGTGPLRWATDGAAYVCLWRPGDPWGAGVARRWDLFSNPSVVTERRPDMPCLLGVG